MEKYTLTFKNPTLEQEYQESRIQLIISSFTLLVIMTVINQLISLIYQLMIGEVSYNTILIMVGYPIVFHLLKRYGQKQIEWIMIVLSQLATIVQMRASESSLSAQDVYILGSNMLALHLIWILLADVKKALFQFCSVILLRFAIGNYQSQLSFEAYQVSIMVMIMLAYVIWLTKKFHRNQFLYKKQESQWDHLLPLIIKNEFYLFSYNKEQMTYEVNISSYQSEKQMVVKQQLTSFLRSHTINGRTFESLIQSRTNKSSQQQINNEYKVKDRNQKEFVIRYSEYYLTQQQFLIIIDREFHQIQKLKSSNEALMAERLALNYNIMSLLSQVYKSLQNKNTYLAKCKLIQGISVFNNVNNNHLSDYNITKRITSIAKQFQRGYKNVINIQSAEIFRAITNPRIFNKLLINLLNVCCIKQEITNIQISQNSTLISISIVGSNVEHLYDALKDNLTILHCVQALGPLKSVDLQWCSSIKHNFISINLFQDLTEKQFSSYLL